MKKNADLKKRNISTDTEFQALREEIMVLTQNRCNFKIAMYTICITILGFSIEKKNSLLTILMYITIFAFQTEIVKTKECCTRLSSYIQIFLEPDRQKFWYWEYHRMFFNEKLWKKEKYKNKKKWYDRISWVGSFLYAIVGVIINITFLLENINIINIFSLCLSIFLTVVVFFLNKRMFDFGDSLCKRYLKDMEDIKRKSNLN